MAILERDVVLQGKTKEGQDTIDLPITALKNIEDTADVKENPLSADYVPIIDSEDNGQMKKMPFSTIESKISKAVTVDSKLSDTSENPVQNKVVQAALKEKASTKEVEEKISAAIGDAIGGEY